MYGYGRGDTEGLITSPVTQVNFAGFRASTAMLASKGWAISADQEVCHSHGGTRIQLSLRHESGVMLMSSAFMLDYRQVLQEITGFQGMNIEFDILGVSLEGRSSFVARPTPVEIDVFASNKESFYPIDTTPRYEKMDMGTIDFDKFCLFRPLNDMATIYVPKATEAELMELILKKQAPKQAEIRERRRKEGLRNGIADMARGSNDLIKAQLVAI